jgi:hypothetical protein
MLAAEAAKGAAADIDAALGAVHKLISDAATAVIGTRVVVQGVTKQWITASVLKLINERRRLYQIWHAEPTAQNREALNLAWQRARAAVSGAKRNAHNATFQKANALWESAPYRAGYCARNH